MQAGIKIATPKGVIYHDDEKPPHLPPWKVGVCLDCYHCFDSIDHERCTACKGKRIASFDSMLESWHAFRKVPTPA